MAQLLQVACPFDEARPIDVHCIADIQENIWHIKNTEM